MSPTKRPRPFVVVVARGVPDEASPLLGRFEFDQAKALQAAGATVVVAALDCRSPRRWRPGAITPWRVRHTSFEGLPVARLDVGLGALPPVVFVPLMRAAWRRMLASIVARHGHPDVVHAHFTRWSAAVTGDVGKPGDRPLVVMTEHSSKLRRGAIPTEDRALGRYAYAADRVLAVSTSLASVLREEFGVEAAVVPDVIDVDAFARPQTTTEVRRPIRLVSVGNLIARKGMARLIRAFAAAFVDGDEELQIIGRGPEQQALEELIESLGMAGRITVAGAKSRAEVAEAFSTSDGFVLLSDHETFGVVYVEAMAAGLPVLATHCGGPEDFITDDVGMFTGSTPEADVAALKSFVRQLGDFDADVISAVARVKYSPAAVADQLLGVYER